MTTDELLERSIRAFDEPFSISKAMSASLDGVFAARQELVKLRSENRELRILIKSIGADCKAVTDLQ